MPVIECGLLNLDAKYIEDEHKYDNYFLYYISDHIYNNCQNSLEDFYLTTSNFNPKGILEIPIQLYGDFKIIFKNTYEKNIDKFIRKINTMRDNFGIPFLSVRLFATKAELKKIYNIEYFSEIKDILVAKIITGDEFRLQIELQNEK